MRRYRHATRARGFTLIEVLVTIVIIAIGLLGLAALQMTSLNNQLEAYQRAQAMLLLEDMANRIRVNGNAARDGDYPDGGNYGAAVVDCSTLTVAAEIDMCEWGNALAGIGVQLEGGDGDDVGSIVGAVGCLENIAGSIDGETIIRLTVAWQGMSPTAAPASTCGQGQFGDEEYRRVASIDTVLADLSL